MQASSSSGRGRPVPAPARSPTTRPGSAVDADSQGALAAALGVQPSKPTLYEVLTGQAAAADAIETTALDRLDVLPADLDLAGAEVELTRRPSSPTATASCCSRRSPAESWWPTPPWPASP